MPKEYAARLKRLKQLEKQGVNPYPANVERDHTIAEFLNNFDKLLKSKKGIIVVGRVRSLRPHGGSAFVDIEDGTDRTQLFIQKNEIGDSLYEQLLDTLDIGDFVCAAGPAYLTKRGQKSIQPKRVQIISKTLLPLPEKWHGLTDTEVRYRKRYLDLVMNKQVRANLVLRSCLITKVREFMDKREYLEVQTPILQPIYGGGFARPFKTHHNALDADMFLRISNEMYLKRLIVGGFEKVYELSTDFRNEGIDHTHNPEFTILEAMTAYKNYFYGMDLIEELTEFVAKQTMGTTKIEYEGNKIDLKRPWKRLTMAEAIHQKLKINVLKLDKKALLKKIQTLKIDKAKIKSAKTWGALVDLLFEEKVADDLIQPTIIYNFPTEVTPLAKKCIDDPRFTESFEQYINGWEIGNNYSEINDPTDLQKRFVEEKDRGKAGFEEAHQTDEDYLEAIMHGMPPTVGIAASIDRLAMLFTGSHNIKEVIPFPTLRPEK